MNKTQLSSYALLVPLQSSESHRTMLCQAMRCL
jgi:hypothetical protein